ncbi:nucleoplasmin-2 [Bombina bombina]|uniref:nucleoplasmin-2 n=1 Tax=Bombina bombina TaxID=8345 RepID=UPI00235A5838|nr:nucleoplasmin-2 [Bombina bombina]
MASTASNTSKLEKPVSLIWGCELSEQNKTAEFKVTDEEDEKCEHQLALRTVCLGDKAKDEFHVIEILPPEQEGKESKPVPIATLKPSILPMTTMVGIELSPPVTFRLKAGSGPVYISGQHIAVVEEDYSWAGDGDEEEGEEEVEEEEDPESPPKAVKRPAATKKAGQAKKKKLDKEEEEESSEEDSPEKKGKGAGRGRKPAAKK